MYQFPTNNAQSLAAKEREKVDFQEPATNILDSAGEPTKTAQPADEILYGKFIEAIEKVLGKEQ